MKSPQQDMAVITDGSIRWTHLKLIYPNLTLELLETLYCKCPNENRLPDEVSAAFVPGEFCIPFSKHVERKRQLYGTDVRSDGVRALINLSAGRVAGVYCGNIFCHDDDNDDEHDMYGLDLPDENYFVDAAMFADKTGPQTVNDDGDKGTTISETFWCTIVFDAENDELKKFRRLHPGILVPIIVQKVSKAVPRYQFLAMAYGDKYWTGKKKEKLPMAPAGSLNHEQFMSLMSSAAPKVPAAKITPRRTQKRITAKKTGTTVRNKAKNAKK